MIVFEDRPTYPLRTEGQPLRNLPAKNRDFTPVFQTNSAPMLLIDPARDGQIVDANRLRSILRLLT